MFDPLAYKLETLRSGAEGRMSSSVPSRVARPATSGVPLIASLFFLSPFLTAAAPRLSPFFLAIIGLVLIAEALRRGLDWRALLKPNAALIALIVVALYSGLSAAWAANPEGALAKSSLLAAATLVVFAASTAIGTLDKEEVRQASVGLAQCRSESLRVRGYLNEVRRSP